MFPKGKKTFPKLKPFFLIALTVFGLLTVFFPTTKILAAARPENNSLCWRQSQCINSCPVAGGCTWEDPSNYPPCASDTGDWGRCIPTNAEPVTLQIPIIGVTQIANIADYIALIYKYIVSVGGILAGIMIMIGGLLYLTAGGSPERVGNAKSYIGNALIGLVLLLTSYVVLQTINPQLVQFSRFTIPLIRPARLPARFCDGFPAPLPTQPPLKFARATVAGTPEIKPLAEIRDTDYNITDLSEMRCGATYYEQASGDETCLGKSCRYTSAPGAGHPGACVPTTDDEKTWDCMNVAFAGTLKSSTPIKDIVLIRTGIDCGLTSFCSCVYDVGEKIWPDFYYVPRMPITPCDLRAGFALSFGDDPSILESFFRVATFSGFNPWRVASADQCTNGQNFALNDQYAGSGNLYFSPFVLTNNDANFHGPAICNVDTDLLLPPSR